MTFKTSVRTIYGSLVQSAGRWGTALRQLPNSTLNQKFQFQPDAKPFEGERVTSKYLAIGLKGVTIERHDGRFLVNFRNYKSSQGALFDHIPFIMRPLDNPLTPEERAPYRGRVIKEYNNRLYELYYLWAFEDDMTPAISEKRTYVGQTITADPWEPTLSDLNPDPDALIPDEPVGNGKEHLAASRKMQWVFTPAMIQEIMECCNIIHGNPNFAELSEFGLVSGVDRRVTGDFGGIQSQYTEAIYAQINDFIRTRISAPNSLGGKIINIDAGSVEPLVLASNQ